jgi:formylmethanofuran dehydrogenase subunit E
VTREAIDWTLSLTDEAVCSVQPRPDFLYHPAKGSFNKALCSVCSERVFERCVRTKDGKPVSIPCSGCGR